MKSSKSNVFMIVLLASFVFQACSQNEKIKTTSQSVDTSISKRDLKEIKESSRDELMAEIFGNDYWKNSGKRPAQNSYIAISKDSFLMRKSLEAIDRMGGKIIFSDSKVGYINFSVGPTVLLNIIDQKLFSNVMISRNNEYTLSSQNRRADGEEKRSWPASNFSSRELMGVDKLQDQFEAEYGVKLDGSNSVIAVFDTGLDITRTDAFSDRIIELRSLRGEDNIVMTDAEAITIDGVDFLQAEIEGQEILIERGERLKSDRKYYLGYLTEAQLKSKGHEEYLTYDLNQDGKEDAVYTVVAFKNELIIFEVYMKVNDLKTYCEEGDQRFEDETQLLDFNWVSKNISDRFERSSEGPLSGFYKYTTRMDILEEKNLLSDRTKGLMNVGVTIEAGFELDEKGENFINVAKEDATQPLYKIGLVGIDYMGHGTHCAGIAAGDFKTAPQFSSGAYKAKIVGVPMIGGTVEDGAFFNYILKLIKKYPNIIFNFSFGGNGELNDTQNVEAQLFDKIAQEYNTVFVKSAGNEGPAIKTHGTTISKNMLSVANYYSTNSNLDERSGALPFDKTVIDFSSSRGPMVDGALKPDIGAP